MSSFDSEEHAFKILGLKNPIISETELIKKFEGLKVPEALFNDNGKIISVEVKRIIGNTLPQCGEGRRRIKRYVKGRERIIWPWTSSVETALSKLHSNVANEFCVKIHVAVFLIPEFLTNSVKERIIRHIKTISNSYLTDKHTSTKVKYFIFDCDEKYFDRL
tara:strand:+ start:343 stop:828 length:486 start_codon:yes stop_codon:yes gene_type:complete